MDKQFPRPKDLSIEPEAPNASRHFNFWLRTVKDFIDQMNENGGSEVSAATKKRIIIICLSPEVYSYVEDAETYENVITTLERVYVKGKNNVFARYLLVSRQQRSDETIAEYLRALKGLAKDCKFADVTADQYKDELTRDAFINGLASPTIRQRLLENDELELQKAYELAESLDKARQQTLVMSKSFSTLASAPPGGVHETDQSNVDSAAKQSLAVTETNENAWRNQSTDSKTCYFCGGDFHSNRKQCPARNALCRHCGKRGHFLKVCLKRSRSSGYTVPAGQVSGPHVSSVVLASAPASLANALVPATLESLPVTVLIDSGASENFVAKRLASSLNLKGIGLSSSVSMASPRFAVKTKGKTSGTMAILGRQYNLEFNILDNLCADVIVGQEFLKRHSRVVFKMGGSEPELIISSVASPPLAAADLVSPRLFKYLSPDCSPVAAPSRRYSKSDMHFIRSEITRLLNSDIIEPSISPWRAPVLVVTRGQKKRLVVDYSVTINRFTQLDAYPLPKIDDIVNTVACDKYYSSLDLRSAYHQIPILEKERYFTAFEADGKLYQYKRLPFGVTNGVAAFQRAIDRFITDNNLEKVHAYLDDITVTGSTLEEHNHNLQRLLNAAKSHRLTLNQEKSKLCRTTLDLLGYRISQNHIQPDPSRLQALLDLRSPTKPKELKRILGMFSYYARWIKSFSSRIQPLLSADTFPLTAEAERVFQELKNELGNVTLGAIRDHVPFEVETDASNSAIGAVLSQEGRPVAFFSRTLGKSEKRYAAVEKEATAIIESVRKWAHFLKGRPFTLITDQKSLAFMLERTNRHKIKNSKILSWKLEQGQYS